MMHVATRGTQRLGPSRAAVLLLFFLSRSMYDAQPHPLPNQRCCSSPSLEDT